MKKRLFSLVGLVVTGIMMMSSLSVFGAYEVPDKDKEWLGNPYMELEEDSPYVQRMNTFAKNALSAYKKDKSGSLLWMVWGYTAPESELKNNEELKKYVFEAMNNKFADLEKNPAGGWDHSSNLSILFMWSKTDNVPAEYEKWKKQYWPSVASYETLWEEKYAEHYAKFLADPEYRTTTLINEDVQVAGLMACAGAVYGREDYVETARKIIHLVSRNQNEDGAFDYFGNSGTIDCYSNFEQGWIGWYYQYTKDPLAEEILTKAAKASVDKLASGVTFSGESPWWKDDFNAGGFMYAPVVVSGIAQDPRTAAIANFRLGYGQNHIGLYIAAPFYDSSLELMEDWYQDLCRYSTNIDGVKLRSGFWNVSMQNKTRAPGAISAIYMPDELYISPNKVGHMMYANMLVLPSGTEVPSNPYRTKANFAVAEGQESNYGCIAGEDFIVSGKTWLPSVTSTSHNEPVDENWKSTQIWFADKNGLAGYMTMTAQANVEAGGIYGVIKTGTEDIKKEEGADFFVQHGLRYDVYGANVEQINQTDAAHFSIVLKDGQAGMFKAGTNVGVGLAVAPEENTQAAVDLLSFDKVMEISVRRDDTDCVIAYNPTDEAVTYKSSLGSVPYYKSNENQDGTYEKGTWKGEITLNKNEIVVIFKSKGETEQLDKAESTVSDEGIKNVTMGTTAKEYEKIENPFIDIDSHWAKQDIIDMASIKAVEGKGNGVFDPNGTISRAEFIAMVLRTVGIKQSSYNGGFTDISGNEWYASVMQTAKDCGIIHDAMMFGGEGRATKPITREEMAYVAIRAVEYKNSIKIAGKDIEFTDNNMISPWSLGAIKSAYNSGVIKGMPDGSFGAKLNSSRSEAAVIVKRLYELN